MSLFQFGFHPSSTFANNETEQQSSVTPAHVPSFDESGLGRLEYNEMVANQAPDLADPSLSAKKKRPYTQQKVVPK